MSSQQQLISEILIILKKKLLIKYLAGAQFFFNEKSFLDNDVCVKNIQRFKYLKGLKFKNWKITINYLIIKKKKTEIGEKPNFNCS